MSILMGKLPGKLEFMILYMGILYMGIKQLVVHGLLNLLGARELGTAAHKLFVRYAFKNYNLKRLQGNVRIFNKASARMLEKSGYKLEGI